MATSPFITLALDAMGGDQAPFSVIEGAYLALKQNPSLRFVLVGDRNKLDPILVDFPTVQSVSDIIHTEGCIKNEDKPSIALRQGRQSSMRLAVNAVAEGKADAVVSAGNTGAYMAIAKFVLKTMAGISRPAIVASFPTTKGSCVMLDLGANVSCDSDNLIEFAVMGDIYARDVMGMENPTIALLNVGAEEMKGSAEVQTAAAKLRLAKRTLNFQGFIEGDRIIQGEADVVVTDGFSGNVAIKASEGMATFMTNLLKESIYSSWISKLGGLLIARPIRRMKDRMNPKLHNGAMLIGLGGIAIKSHGGADGVAYANAIKVATQMVSHGLQKQIEEKLHALSLDLQEAGDGSILDDSLIDSKN
jgi:glycerol-3-phosphate acyltransferase PlsX